MTRHVRPDWRSQKVAALRQGRKNRSVQFRDRSKYTRKRKHRKGTHT